MAKLIPAAERITRARAIIQKARELPRPSDTGSEAFSYVAQVRDLLRQARDLVKLIPYSVSTTPEMKKEVAQIMEEADEVAKALKG
jgi:hypothetical protein